MSKGALISVFSSKVISVFSVKFFKFSAHVSSLVVTRETALIPSTLTVLIGVAKS